MSAYVDFKYDFIQRTLDEILRYDGQYEVTALLNSCIGLLIIPKETLFNKLPTIDISDYDLDKKYVHVNDGRNNAYSIKNIVIHLRNSIAHGYFQQESIQAGQIKSLKFQDFNPPNRGGNKTFEIVINVDQFREFVIKVAKEVLETR